MIKIGNVLKIKNFERGQAPYFDEWVVIIKVNKNGTFRKRWVTFNSIEHEESSAFRSDLVIP